MFMLAQKGAECIKVDDGTGSREHKGDILASTTIALPGEVQKVMRWTVNARVDMVGQGNKREKVRIRILA